MPSRHLVTSVFVCAELAVESRHTLIGEMLSGIAVFPPDMEVTLRRIHAYDPALLDSVDPRYFPLWKAGQELSSGRALLQAIGAFVTTKTRPLEEITH